jgi:MFS family permease
MDCGKDRRRRAVRRVAIARLISLAGTDASGVAFSFGLYAQTRSTLWLAAGMLITFGLGSVLGPVGGMLADRYDRKRLMIGAELAGAACFAVLPVWHTPPAMLGVAVLATFAGLVFGPAANAAIPNLAGEQDLAWANSQVALGGTLGKTVGRCGAGALVALLGFQAVFALDAVSFLCSAACIVSARGSFQSARAAAPGARRRKVWTLALRNPMLRPLVVCSMVATFVTSFSMTAETVLVFRYDAGPLGLGLLAAAWALGMVAGSWYSGRALHADNEPTGLFAGRLVMGAGLGAVGAMPVFWPVLACYAVGGAAGGFLLVATQSMMQRFTDDALRGRVLAAADSLRNAAFGVGVVCAGFGVGLLGPQLTYVTVGIGVVLSSLPALTLVRATGGLRSLRPATAGA